jgi:hypothetical protein
MKLACGTTEHAVHANVTICCFHTPSLTVTVLSPGRFVLRHSTKYEAHTIYSNHKIHPGYAHIHGLGWVKDIYKPGMLHDTLLYSRDLYAPSETSGIHALYRVFN